MRPLIILFSFLAIIAFAAIGSLYIFDVKTGDEALELLLQTEGAILLFGVCAFAVSVLTRSANRGSQD